MVTLALVVFDLCPVSCGRCVTGVRRSGLSSPPWEGEQEGIIEYLSVAPTAPGRTGGFTVDQGWMGFFVLGPGRERVESTLMKAGIVAHTCNLSTWEAEPG